jgi:tetratricopeptide (TPR) repeat protein
VRSTRAQLPGASEAEIGVHHALVRGRHGLFLVNRNDVYVGRALLAYGEYGELEWQLLRQLCRPGAYVVDGRLDEAGEARARLVAQRPDFALAHKELGLLRVDRNEARDALASLLRAVELEPRDPTSHVALGVAFRHLGRLEQAVQAQRNAVRLSPNLVGAHFNLAISLLALGHWDEGFREYEWRLHLSKLPIAKLPVQKPRWCGDDLRGRRILLRAEQGLGDAILCIRFARELAERGGQVFVRCVPALRRLLVTAPGVAGVGTDTTVPVYDLHCPLFSLPHHLGLTPESVPARVPYLEPPRESVAAWRRRLGTRKQPRIGLVWSTEMMRTERFHVEDRDKARRCVPFEQLEPLLRTKDLEFVSLQRVHERHEREAMRRRRVRDVSDGLTDLAETAALVSQCDAVVAIDTSVTHLAGALGKPVFTLVPWPADWRWLTGRNDTPWYPTMRLFRARPADDWSSAVAALCESVARWRSGAPSPTACPRPRG